MKRLQRYYNEIGITKVGHNILNEPEIIVKSMIEMSLFETYFKFQQI